MKGSEVEFTPLPPVSMLGRMAGVGEFRGNGLLPTARQVKQRKSFLIKALAFFAKMFGAELDLD